eukprot:CAMPEP_0204834706 /NCGR_PEP_ID=MMETSP1346-20131115/20520_1 /ASSEMBLY_ACC=CAM_ASM_000771 /TAXON_ID=215587 /ORGANISM="Aplanochytrium stocchinoi, Strain GSBS06" /LENGTH=404 /DNA_ID=CAMNT_0051968175 /DNA_START=610 /DNA_END=1824 /DNA_ORIENTATION=-
MTSSLSRGERDYLHLDKLPRPPLRRQKALVPREKILESATILLEQGSTQQALLSVEFSGETGHGLGPTREFYSLACQELQKAELGIWRHSTDDPLYILFPKYLKNDDKKKKLKYFRLMGRLIGKSFLDGRLLDLPFSVTLCKLLLDEPVNLDDVIHIDEVLGRSLVYLLQLCLKYESLCAQQNEGVVDVQDSLEEVSAEVSGMCLYFTVPGDADRKLIVDGENIQVTAERLREYLDLVAQKLLVDDVLSQVCEIKDGIDEIFHVSSLQVFSAVELQQMISLADSVKWDKETIENNVICKYGYEVSDEVIQNLLSVLASFDQEQRKNFLLFITGTPRLPVGGWENLSPKLTIVKKSCDNEIIDKVLPTCSTCQVYLKLPQYSSKEILKEKLVYAITNGQNYFALD